MPFSQQLLTGIVNKQTAYDSTEAVKQLKMKLNWLKNGAYK